MSKRWLYLLLLMISIFISIISVYFFRKNHLLNVKTIKEKSVVEKSALKTNPAWVKEIQGKYDQTRVTVRIEFDQDLCQKRSWCGFEEHKGRFEDVANTVAYAVYLLNGKVKVNMLIDPEGKFVVLKPAEWQEKSFNPSSPIRFLYFDYDNPVNRFAWDNSSYFSRGWGIDSQTEGLVFFLSISSAQKPDYAASMIREALYLITGVVRTDGAISKPAEYEKFINFWTRGHPERIKLTPQEGGTLKILEKK